MRSVVASLGVLGLILVLAGCREKKQVSARVQPAEQADEFATIAGVKLQGSYVQIPYYGDLWVTTWGKDGHLYSIFGDGTGMRDRLPTLLMDEQDEFDRNYVQVRPGWYKVKDPRGDAAEWCEIYDCSKAYRLAPYTPAGLVRLRGSVPRFRLGTGPEQDILARHIPYGDLRAFEHMDKPSSLVAVGKRFYAHMHYPPGKPVRGYLAWSDDSGRTWHHRPRSPWGGKSPFRVAMFFNMGRAYRLNADGYLYALGVGTEADLDPPRRQRVYLLRVPLLSGRALAQAAPEQWLRRPAAEKDPVLDYDRYEYFAGHDATGQVRWVSDPEKAEPLGGIFTIAQGSAMYHPGLKRYLFLSGLIGTAARRELFGPEVPEPDQEHPAGAVFEAPAPWGPWRLAGRFPAGYIASWIPKGTGPDSAWFAAAGGGGVTYALNLARLKFIRRTPRHEPARVQVLDTRKVEQVVGDWDFETLRRTRQQTETRFNLAHTDLGVPVEHRGKLWLLFGDSDPEAPGWDEFHDDSLAWTTARTARELKLHFLTDPRGGRGYLNPRIRFRNDPKRDVDLGALNVPVAAVSDEQTLFVWFTTDAAGRSLLARSDDGGRTFWHVYDFGSTHFIDLAAVRVDGPPPGLAPSGRDGPWVLVFGSGNHQHPHVYLAATPLEALRRGDRGRVWFLSRIEPAPKQWKLSWSRREADAVPLFHIEHGQGPGVMSEVPHAWGFGEPLIHYNHKLRLWMATYNSARRTIRLRTAPRPWGPWSASVVLFDPARDYGRGPAYGRYIGNGRVERLGGQGELYGPYVIPRFTRVLPDGQVKLYWLLSPWQPYTVLLMESTLRIAAEEHP